jgi:hypothetical protein|tara:strand:- start:4080 stop:4235 length:156 start_codon:yes stop_codon:yes gene_type:complete
MTPDQQTIKDLVDAYSSILSDKLSDEEIKAIIEELVWDLQVAVTDMISNKS